MTDAARFRALALALPDANEGSHHGHADFRCGGRVFASLHPGEAVGMVVLPPARQQELLRAATRGLRPANGAWGRSGCTLVDLAAVDHRTLRALLADAWQRAMAAAATRRRRPPGRRAGGADG